MYILLRFKSGWFGWKLNRETPSWYYILQDIQATLRSLIKKSGIYRVHLSLYPKRGYRLVSVWGQAYQFFASSNITLGKEKSILCYDFTETVFGKTPRRFYFKITKDRKPKKVKS